MVVVVWTVMAVMAVVVTVEDRYRVLMVVSVTVKGLNAVLVTKTVKMLVTDVVVKVASTLVTVMEWVIGRVFTAVCVTVTSVTASSLARRCVVCVTTAVARDVLYSVSTSVSVRKEVRVRTCDGGYSVSVAVV